MAVSLRPFGAIPGWVKKHPELPANIAEIPVAQIGSVPQAGATASDLIAYQTEVIKAIGAIVERQAAMLDELTADTELSTPQGVVHFETYTLQPGIVVDLKFDPPLFSVSIANDGPGALQFRIPNRSSSTWSGIAVNDPLVFNARKGVFTSGAVKNPGSAGTTTVRITGLY